jgi:hypothetical protein
MPQKILRSSKFGMQHPTLAAENSDREGTDRDYREAFLLERHKREEIQKKLIEDRDLSDRTLRSYQDVLCKLHDASNSLRKLADLSSECEIYKTRVDSLSNAISVIAPIALRGATSVSEKLAIMQACEGFEMNLWSNLRVRYISGLPRLRVFSDDICYVSLVMLIGDARVWTSGLFPVSQSSMDDSSFETAPDLNISIPTAMLSGAENVCIAIDLEGSIVAESKPVSVDDISSSFSMPLFHNGIPLPSGSIMLYNVAGDLGWNGMLQLRVLSMEQIDPLIDLPDSGMSGFIFKFSVPTSGVSVYINFEESRAGRFSEMHFQELGSMSGPYEIKLETNLNVGSHVAAFSELPVQVKNNEACESPWKRKMLTYTSLNREPMFSVVIEYRAIRNAIACTAQTRDG